MEFKDLKNIKESELHGTLAESREKLRSLRFKDASKQLKNVREIRQIKKQIAQILMILGSRKDNVKKD